MRATRRLLVVALLAAVLVPQHPAPAPIVAADVFVGSMTVGGGLALPVVGGIPTVPPGQHCNLPLGVFGQLPTNCHLNWGGNIRGILAVTTNLCVHGEGRVLKPWKAPLSAGTCSIALAAGLATEGNHTHGFCALNGGQTRITRAGPDNQLYAVDAHWNGPFVSGHWVKPTTGQTGLLVGLIVVVPVPSVTGTTLGNSCSAGSATTFTLAGTWALLPA